MYSSFTPETIRFDYTGAVQTWTVPAGCTKLIVDCVGAAGGYYSNTTDRGFGGRVQCKINVIGGDILYLYIGGMGASRQNQGVTSGGYNGGGNGCLYDIYGGNYAGGGAGGGASDIRLGGTSLSDRKIIAGGGGGGVRTASNVPLRKGGNGGGLVGEDGQYSSGYTPAKGGTQVSGGSGGGAYSVTSGSGSLGTGGTALSSGGGAGGGGGGGYYGGGSGYYNSGAGGSSYTDPNLCSDVVHTQGYSEATGNGWIIITTSN